MIGLTNDRYFRLFDMLRAVQIKAKLSHPDLSNHNFPAFKICE